MNGITYGKISLLNSCISIRTVSYTHLDVYKRQRHIQGSFFEGLKKRAEALEVGEGLHIIQTFEPHPLYAVMEGLGYEHYTEQRGCLLYTSRCV